MADNSFRKAFYHLELALRYFEDVAREAPGTLAAKKSTLYKKRLEWIKMDFASDPLMPSAATADFLKDMNGDVFFPSAIAEKALRIPEDCRDSVERIFDLIIEGKRIEVTATEE